MRPPLEYKVCEYRHKENGNCMIVGGFCGAHDDDTCVKHMQAENARLKAKLEGAEKERDAAVEDIKSMEVGPQTFPPDICTICKKNHISCSTGGSACKGFEWRGPKEEGSE